MSGGDNSIGNRDLKKLLGNPKITFVLGNLLERLNMFKVVLLQVKVLSVLNWWRNLAILTYQREI